MCRFLSSSLISLFSVFLSSLFSLFSFFSLLPYHSYNQFTFVISFFNRMQSLLKDLPSSAPIVTVLDGDHSLNSHVLYLLLSSSPSSLFTFLSILFFLPLSIMLQFSHCLSLGYPSTLTWLGAVNGNKTKSLGVSSFGQVSFSLLSSLSPFLLILNKSLFSTSCVHITTSQSGDLYDLYAHHGIDAPSIVKASKVMLEGKV